MYYMQHLDEIETKKIGKRYYENMLTILMVAKKQSSIYQQFLLWNGYSMENVRSAMQTTRSAGFDFSKFDSFIRSNKIK